MGNFTSATSSKASSSAGRRGSGHADQIQGAPSAAPASPAATSAPSASATPAPRSGISYDAFGDPMPVPVTPAEAGVPLATPDILDSGFRPNDGVTVNESPHPVASAGPNAMTGPGCLQPHSLSLQGEGGARAPSVREGEGLAPRTTMLPGEQPVFHGGGNKPENAELVQKQNADARRAHRKEQSIERQRNEERAKQQRAQQRATEQAYRNAARKKAMQPRASQIDIMKALGKASTTLDQWAKAQQRAVDNEDPHPVLLPVGEGTHARPHPLSLQGEGKREAQGEGLSEDATQDLDRFVGALEKRKGTGDASTFVADGITTDPKRGMTELDYVLKRMTDPAQAQELFTRTREKLRGDTRAAFDQRFRVAEEPAESPEAEKGSANQDEVDDDQGNEDNNQEEIEWNEKPSEQVYDGRNEFNVDGPIKIDLKTNTFGVDGLRYEVDWYTLDKDGRVVPEWRSDTYKPEPGGGYAYAFERENKETFHPPIPSKYGYRLIIRVPPQPNYNANAAGSYLDVYSPKGSKLDKIIDR